MKTLLLLLVFAATSHAGVIGWKVEMDLPAAEKRAGKYVERYVSAFYLLDREGRFRYDLELGARFGQKWLKPDERGHGSDKYTNSAVYGFDKVLPYYDLDLSYMVVKDKPLWPDIGVGFEWFNPWRVSGSRNDQYYYQKIRIFLEQEF